MNMTAIDKVLLLRWLKMINGGVIRCTIKETGTKEFLQRLAGIERLDMADLAEATRKRMIGIIDENRKRIPKVGSERYLGRFKTHLKNSLTVTGTTNGLEISVDEKKTPYWEVVDTNPRNYVPGPVRGQFTDSVMGANNGGSFAYNPDMPTMHPKKVIEPMNFLEKTNLWVEKNLRKYVDRAIAEQLIGSRFKNRLLTSRLLKNFKEETSTV